MDDKLAIAILSELEEIKRLIANGGLSPPLRDFASAGSVTWRLNATEEEAKEFSRKKAIARRRAKR